MTTVFISPDLGWTSLDSMLSPPDNPMAVSVQAAELEAATGSPTGVISRTSRTIISAGVDKDLPLSVIVQLTANGVKHYYRDYDGITYGPLREFVLRIGTPSIP